MIEGNSTEKLRKPPEPIRRPIDPPKPKKMPGTSVLQKVKSPVHQMAAAPVCHKKAETTKKTETKTATVAKKEEEEEEDVLAKVNSVIPPFSPCRERSSRQV